MKRRFLVSLVSACVLLVALALYLPALDIPLLQPAGPVAAQQRSVILLTILLCSLVVIPVFGMLFYVARTFRADSPIARDRLPAIDEDPRMELIWWAVPAVIIGILAVVAWRTSHSLDPYEPLPGSERGLEVRVIALEWKWLFIYPQYGIASVNALKLPAGVPVHFVLTADAPMNSFWIPQLGGQIMVMPGMTTQLYLQADQPGTYGGFSANMSGEGFSSMTFDAEAMPAEAFAQWVAAVLGNPASAPLDRVAYESLARPSSYVPPVQYAPVESGLYDAVVRSFMAPVSPREHSLPMEMDMHE